MTDKEIFINGANVAGCEFRSTIAGGFYGLDYCKCFGHVCGQFPNCYFKQFARKTQECNELKEEIEYSHNQNIRWAKAWTKMWRQRNRYKQALEKIEDAWEKDKDGDYHCIKSKILDIISKENSR